MSINKIEIQDGGGNVYYPKTSIDSVIYSDNTSIEEKIRILEYRLNELKSQLANSINNKTGSSLTSNSTVDEMTVAINSIKTLEQATADANATASNILVDKTAYVNGAKVTGIMPNNGTSTNTLTLNGSLTLPKGYYDSIKVKQSVTTKGSTTDAISHGHNGDYIYTRIPQGAYFTNASTGYPEIKSKFADIANAIGLTPDKIVGNVGGINGTYKSINDIWAYTPGTITLPSERENTTIVSIPFEPSIIMGFCMTETGKTYSATNPTGGDIRWGVGNGRFFKIMSGSYAFKHVDITQNRTCIQDVTYSGGKLTIYSKGSYGGSDYRYTFMVIAIK